MRNEPPPGHTRVSDWVGKKAKLRLDIGNGNGIWPAGTVVTVENNNTKGLCLVSDPCPHCGVMLRMTRVQSKSLEYIEPAAPAA